MDSTTPVEAAPVKRRPPQPPTVGGRGDYRSAAAQQAGCPCGSGRSLADCCGHFHAACQEGRLADLAPDALSLMRSRYSAFVLDRLDYLQATWHPAHRPPHLSGNEAGLTWLGLSIKAHQRIDADHETVEFVARSKLGGRAHRLHELSRFVREAGRWYYVDGDLR